MKSWQVGGVRVVMLARPQKANALDTTMVTELEEALTAPPEGHERCCLLAGEGSNFCAGADRDILHRHDDQATELVSALEHLFHQLESQPLPIVAWLNGPAIGAGAILASVADIRLVAPTARLSVPAGEYSIRLNSWVVETLAAQFGQSAARYLVLGGGTFNADRLLEVGVAQRPAADLDEAIAYATAVAAFDPEATSVHRRMLQLAAHSTRHSADTSERKPPIDALGRASSDASQRV